MLQCYCELSRCWLTLQDMIDTYWDGDGTAKKITFKIKANNFSSSISFLLYYHYCLAKTEALESHRSWWEFFFLFFFFKYPSPLAIFLPFTQYFWFFSIFPLLLSLGLLLPFPKLVWGTTIDFFPQITLIMTLIGLCRSRQRHVAQWSQISSLRV